MGGRSGDGMLMEGRRVDRGQQGHQRLWARGRGLQGRKRPWPRGRGLQRGRGRGLHRRRWWGLKRRRRKLHWGRWSRWWRRQGQQRWWGLGIHGCLFTTNQEQTNHLAPHFVLKMEKIVLKVFNEHLEYNYSELVMCF